MTGRIAHMADSRYCIRLVDVSLLVRNHTTVSEVVIFGEQSLLCRLFAAAYYFYGCPA